MRKRMVRVGAGWLLCSVWSMCIAATQAGQQIIFEGGAHTFGPVKSSGNGVPLLDALERIVPTSYSVNMPNAGAWAEMPVSWRSGAFVTVLGQVLAQDTTLQARVNTDLQLVTVSKKAIEGDDVASLPKSTAWPTPIGAVAPRHTPPAMHATMVSVAMHEANTANNPAAVGPITAASAAPTAAPLPAPSAAPLAAPSSVSLAAPFAGTATTAGTAGVATSPEQTTWQLTRADGSVRNALSRWASESGWQFVWDVPTDFSIDAAATLHGTLEEALNAVVNALSTSQVPIQIVMYKGNRVLRVVAKGAG